METKNNWIFEGIVFAIFMLVINGIIDSFAGNFTFDQYWKKIIAALVGGLFYGIIMKYIRSRNKG